MGHGGLSRGNAIVRQPAGRLGPRKGAARAVAWRVRGGAARRHRPHLEALLGRAF